MEIYSVFCKCRITTNWNVFNVCSVNFVVHFLMCCSSTIFFNVAGNTGSCLFNMCSSRISFNMHLCPETIFICIYAFFYFSDTFSVDEGLHQYRFVDVPTIFWCAYCLPMCLLLQLFYMLIYYYVGSFGPFINVQTSLIGPVLNYMLLSIYWAKAHYHREDDLTGASILIFSFSVNSWWAAYILIKLFHLLL